MTKIEAIAKVMEDNGGTANLDIIYNNITKYYPSAKSSEEWKAGLRGVLYREVDNNRKFKKIGVGLYALYDYKEDAKPEPADSLRMHSYIEGICLELGNFEKYLTYTADPAVSYRDNLLLRDVATKLEMPNFSYREIIQEVKRIDVVWFNKDDLAFPKRVYEVVDSIGTLDKALNRCLQLQHFATEFFIVGPQKHRNKFDKTIELEIYKSQSNRFKFLDYESIIALYDATLNKYKLEKMMFG